MKCETRMIRPVPDPEKSHRSFLLVMGSMMAAVVASFCCILPIVFAVTGFTVMGASAAFARWRPYLLALTAGLLGFGFYFAYRPAKAECGPNGICARPVPKRSGRLMLWLATATIMVLAGFPYFSGPVAELLLSSKNSGPALVNQARLEYASIAIEGMDCVACATAVENRLKAVSGVHEAKVTLESSTAEVRYDPGSVSVEQLEKAIQDAGYRVRK